ncbi:MAG: amidohydrolase family protein [Gammaproteobacteria bacterium]|nr:amidohydrolase family protein [Gammaproteobacteria bacterium]MCP4090818.1 amidohydrolase family protein [Gammaproteobacteria bacterium]MCP4277245.1 amidohydrolase family protein [Gammaproteobacteria bacterium]MCP4832867.1 amidohydrolase family protein [Gammaproteobacteria bacterium]MCP4928966.1 amidohydrolase family protein [Gammaproteobacteria bacterium]
MKFLHALMLLTALAYLSMTTAHAYNGPVIDMHVHAWPSGTDGGPDEPKNQAALEAEWAELQSFNIVLAVTSGPEAFLEAWEAAQPTELLPGPIFPCIDGKNPVFYRHTCFTNGENFPNIEWLEEQYTSGRFGVMGELYNQYAAIPYDDPRMDPYYELAERLGIPVAFHTHSAPPLTAQQCCPDFRIANGNPLLIENVLVKYPKLKAYIMHANPLVYPEVLDLLVQFPKVYVDVSPWQMAYTRKKFHRLLQEYVDAGLIGRVMFGSDGANYKKAFDAYTSAEFLSKKQLEGIFCMNAERFLRKNGICDSGSD